MEGFYETTDILGVDFLLEDGLQQRELYFVVGKIAAMLTDKPETFPAGKYRLVLMQLHD